VRLASSARASRGCPSLASTLRGLGSTNEQVASILRHASSRTTAMLYGGLPNDTIVSIREQAAALS
jgi:hypothetical protein